jgi:archaemetzincin
MMNTRRAAGIAILLAVAAGAGAYVLRSGPGGGPAPVAEDGFERLGPPQPGEWRARFKEPPQSFEKYVNGSVNRKSDRRTTFYIQPLGDAGTRYRETLERMRAFAEAYFGVPARVLDPIPMFEDSYAPGRSQYDSTAIIRRLADRHPEDALAYMGITCKDLYSEGLNFVFGEGSLTWRCGVYSLVRYETPDDVLFTRRSLKLLAHEAGHIFSIEHCVAYACVMQGANTLAEHDRHPLHLCPIDLRKILWNTGADRDDRYRRLERLYRQWGCMNEADWVSMRLGS